MNRRKSRTSRVLEYNINRNAGEVMVILNSSKLAETSHALDSGFPRQDFAGSWGRDAFLLSRTPGLTVDA